jgi:hypothetical protein
MGQQKSADVRWQIGSDTQNEIEAASENIRQTWCPYSAPIISLWRRVNKKLDEDPSTSHDFVTLVGLVSYYGAD